MTDAEKEEIRLIVREEIWNTLREASGGISPATKLSPLQLIDKLIETAARRAETQQPHRRQRP